MLVGCNKDGTDTATGGNATPATSSSIVGKWYYPNELIDFKQQPEFDFKADGTVTGNYVGKWKLKTGRARTWWYTCFRTQCMTALYL